MDGINQPAGFDAFTDALGIAPTPKTTDVQDVPMNNPAKEPAAPQPLPAPADAQIAQRIPLEPEQPKQPAAPITDAFESHLQKQQIHPTTETLNAIQEGQQRQGQGQVQGSIGQGVQQGASSPVLRQGGQVPQQQKEVAPPPAQPAATQITSKTVRADETVIPPKLRPVADKILSDVNQGLPPTDQIEAVRQKANAVQSDNWRDSMVPLGTVNGKQVYAVNGDIINRMVHMDFVDGDNGAHDAKNADGKVGLKPNEIIVDAQESAERMRHIIVHEAMEMHQMERGVPYDKAHPIANATERESMNTADAAKNGNQQNAIMDAVTGTIPKDGIPKLSDWTPDPSVKQREEISKNVAEQGEIKAGTISKEPLPAPSKELTGEERTKQTISEYVDGQIADKQRRDDLYDKLWKENDHDPVAATKEFNKQELIRQSKNLTAWHEAELDKAERAKQKASPDDLAFYRDRPIEGGLRDVATGIWDNIANKWPQSVLKTVAMIGRMSGSENVEEGFTKEAQSIQRRSETGTGRVASSEFMHGAGETAGTVLSMQAGPIGLLPIISGAIANADDTYKQLKSSGKSGTEATLYGLAQFTVDVIPMLIASKVGHPKELNVSKELIDAMTPQQKADIARKIVPAAIKELNAWGLAGAAQEGGTATIAKLSGMDPNANIFESTGKGYVGGAIGAIPFAGIHAYDMFKMSKGTYKTARESIAEGTKEVQSAVNSLAPEGSNPQAGFARIRKPVKEENVPDPIQAALNGTEQPPARRQETTPNATQPETPRVEPTPTPRPPTAGNGRAEEAPAPVDTRKEPISKPNRGQNEVDPGKNPIGALVQSEGGIRPYAKTTGKDGNELPYLKEHYDGVPLRYRGSGAAPDQMLQMVHAKFPEIETVEQMNDALATGRAGQKVSIGQHADIQESQALDAEKKRNDQIPINAMKEGGLVFSAMNGEPAKWREVKSFSDENVTLKDGKTVKRNISDYVDGSYIAPDHPLFDAATRDKAAQEQAEKNAPQKNLANETLKKSVQDRNTPPPDAAKNITATGTPTPEAAQGASTQGPDIEFKSAKSAQAHIADSPELAGSKVVEGDDGKFRIVKKEGANKAQPPETPEVSEISPSERSVGVKREDVDQRRAERGESEIPTGTVKKPEQVLEDAKQMSLEEAKSKHSDQKGRAQRLVEEMNQTPRPLSNEEIATLHIHTRVLDDAITRNLEIMESKTATDTDKLIAQMDWKEASTQMDALDHAVRAQSKEWHQSGMMMMQMLNKNYTFDVMRRGERAASELAGHKWTAEDDARVKASAEKIASTQKDIDSAISDAVAKAKQERDLHWQLRTEAQTKKALEQQKKELEQLGRVGQQGEKFDSRVWKIAQDTVSKWKKDGDESLKWLMAPERRSSASAGVDPTVIYHLARYARAEIGEKGLKFAEWSANAIRDIGEHIRPHLEQAWKQANALIDKEVSDKATRRAINKNSADTRTAKEYKENKANDVATRIKDAQDLISEKMNAGNTKIAAQIKEVVNARIAEDPSIDRDTLLSKAHEDLKDVITTITPEEIQEAYSGTGKYWVEPKEIKDPAKLKEGEIRRDWQLQSKTRIAEGGERPGKQIQRDQNAKFNEAMKKFVEANPEDKTYMATVQERIGTALTNRKNDLLRAIKNNKEITRRTGTVDNPANAELRRQVAEIQREYDEKFPKEELTPEEKVERATHAAEFVLADLEKQVADLKAGKGVNPRDVAKPDPIRGPKLDLLRAKIDEARANRDVLREHAFQLKDRAREDAYQRVIDEKQRRVNEKDVAYPEKSEKKPDTPLMQKLRTVETELDAEIEKIRNDTGLTTERKIAKSIEAAEKAERRYKNQANGIEQDNAGKKTGVWSQELDQANSARDAAKQYANELRDAANKTSAISDMLDKLNSPDLGGAKPEKSEKPQTTEQKFLADTKAELATRLEKARADAGLNDAAKRAESIRALDKAIAKVQADLDAGKRIEPDITGKKAAWSPEIADQHKTLEALKQMRSEMDRYNNPPEAPWATWNRLREAQYKKQKAIFAQQRETQDFAPRQKPEQPFKMDERTQKAYEENQAEKNKRDAAKEKWDQEARPLWQKIIEAWPMWRRGWVLSSIAILDKLVTAAALRGGSMRIEQLASSVIAKTPGKIGRIAKGSPLYGKFDIDVELHGLGKAWTKGPKEAWKMLTTRTDSLHTLHGENKEAFEGVDKAINSGNADFGNGIAKAIGRTILDPKFLEYLGSMHGAAKTILFTDAHTRAFDYVQKWKSEQIDPETKKPAFDVTSPAEQMRSSSYAFEYAQRQIFLNDNAAVDFYKRGLARLEQKDPKTGHPSPGLLTVSSVIRGEIPIVKIPVNIVAETLEYLTGLPHGLWNVLCANAERLDPHANDTIMRQLTKGSVGLIAVGMYLGFMNNDKFKVGSFFTRGLKTAKGESSMKEGDVKVGDFNVPARDMHHPLIGALSYGSTVIDVSKSLHKGQPRGVPLGLVAATLGLAEMTPYMKEMTDLAKLADVEESQKVIGQHVSGYVVPGLLSSLARATDKQSNSNEPWPLRERQSRNTTGGTLGEEIKNNIKSDIPFVRQDLPIKTSSHARKSTPYGKLYTEHQ